MPTDLIRKHFVEFLGRDVGVSITDHDNPRDVVLYRPDRLSDPFVMEAFEALRRIAPSAAEKVGRLLIAFDTRSGRTQRGVDLTGWQVRPNT